MIAWVYLLLAFGALAVAFKTASVGVMAVCLLVALGLILAWVMALLAQRIGSRSRSEHAMIDADELRRLREQAEARKVAPTAPAHAPLGGTAPSSAAPDFTTPGGDNLR